MWYDKPVHSGWMNLLALAVGLHAVCLIFKFLNLHNYTSNVKRLKCDKTSKKRLKSVVDYEWRLSIVLLCNTNSSDPISDGDFSKLRPNFRQSMRNKIQYQIQFQMGSPKGANKCLGIFSLQQYVCIGINNHHN